MIGLGQTTITIPVDLSRVQVLRSGEDWAALADMEACEVYVVTRDRGRVTVVAITVNADAVRVTAEARP